MKSLQVNIIVLFIAWSLVIPVVQAESFSSSLFLSSLDRQLFLAVHSGDENAVRDALDRGADVNVARKENGDTALHVVAYYGNVGIARILLAAGAGVDAKNNVGDTPLHVTAGAGLNWYGQQDVARLILETDVDIDATNRLGVTPLFQAWAYSFLIFDMLLEAGANVNIPTNNGNTVLKLAINRSTRSGGYPLTIWRLLDHGADISDLGPVMFNKLMELLRNNPRIPRIEI